MSKTKKLVTTCITVAAIIAVMVYLCMSNGCNNIKLKSSDVETYQEVAYTATYVIMHKASAEDIAMFSGSADALVEVMESEDLMESIRVVKNYVITYTDYVTPEYQFYIDNALRLLDKLVVMDLEVPENKKEVLVCLTAFIKGVQEGLQYIVDNPLPVPVDPEA